MATNPRRSRLRSPQSEISARPGAGLTRFVLAGLVGATALFPGFPLSGSAAAAVAPACTDQDTSGAPCGHDGAIHAPDCSTVPGLAEPPELLSPFSAPPAEPPLRGDKVGSLAGFGQVTSVGSYRYRLPLAVPEGRAGMQPALALVYESRTKNGHLGVGWQLEGLSAIERCPKTFATEGQAEGVQLDSHDAFCLDGHKLVAIQGGYGGDGTEYRTEDDMFARIRSFRGGQDRVLDRFQVWTRGGRIQTYTAVMLPAKQTSAPVSFAWVLTEEKDRAGNAMRITYDTRTAVADWGTYVIEYFPKQIDYTLQTHANPEGFGWRSVTFHYESRPDHSFAIVDNARVETTQRLASIEMSAPNPNATAIVWRYTLGYAPSAGSGASLLKSVRQCGADGSCLPEKRFTWESTQGPTFAKESMNGRGAEEPPIVADLDGDGRDELVLLGSHGNYARITEEPEHPLGVEKLLGGNFQGVRFSEVKPVDLESNGRFGLLAPNANTHFYHAFWLVNALSDNTPWLTDVQLDDQPYDPGANSPLAIGDLDGDGRADLVRGDPTSWPNTWHWSYRLTKGSVIQPGAVNTPIDSLTAPPLRAFSGRNLSYVRDDGHFRASLLVGGVPSGKLTNAYGVQWNPAEGATLTVETTGYEGQHAYGDVNGDGRRDEINLSGSSLWINDTAWPEGRVSTHIDFGPLGKVKVEDCRMQVADLDADGADEVIVSCPDAPNAVLDLRLDGSLHFVQSTLAIAPPEAIGDFNGDGLLDVAGRQDGYWSVYRQTGHGTADRMVAAGDEGNPTPRESVVYSMAWSPSPEAATCSYPQRCMKHGFIVVREHQTDQGEEVVPASARARRQLYNYENPRFDVRGAGFVGFATVRTWDPSRTAETITTYDNQTREGEIYPYALRPKVVQHVVAIDGKGGAARVTRIEQNYQLEHLHQNRSYFVHPSDWHAYEWEQDVTVNRDEAAKVHLTEIDSAGPRHPLRARWGQATFDDFGNAKTTVTHTGNGVATTATYTYEVREDDWLIALPKTEQVVSGEPGMQPPPVPRHRAFEHDARGFLCHVLIEKDDPDPTIPEVITFTRDVDGLVVAITTSAVGETSRTVHIAYEPIERVFRAQVWNDLGHSNWFRYHPAFGVLQAFEDENGVHTYQTVDTLGRVRKVVRDGQGSKAIVYAPRFGAAGTVLGYSVSVTEEAGGASRTDLDILGRPVEHGHKGFDGTWFQEATRYDGLGRVVSVTRPGAGAPSSEATAYGYDNLDRETQETLPDGKTIRSKHTFFETRTTDPRLQEHSIVRDVDDRIVQSIERLSPKDLVTSYHYGAFDELDRITDPTGIILHIEHDQRGRRSAVVDPDAGPTELYYNGFNELKTTIRSAGLITHQHRDLLGRVFHVDDPDGTTKYTWDTAPHGVGKLAQTQSPDGTTQALTYDDLSRPLTETWTVDGESFAFEQSYDMMGRVQSLKYPEVAGRTRFAVGQVYNPAGYLRRVFDKTASTASTAPKDFWTVTGRNGDDQLTQATIGKGLESVRDYEPATGRLHAITTGSALSLGYDYDENGNVAHRSDGLANRLDSFSYDALQRLETWTVSTRISGPPGFPDAKPVLRTTEYGYDNLGNLTKVKVNKVVTQDNVYGETGKPHTLTHNATGAFVYDDRGRQFQAPTRAVEFTEFDLPRQVTTAAGETQFTYDAAHQRVKKQGPTGTVISLGGLYERRGGNGSQIQHVFYVQGSEGPVAAVVYAGSATETSYLHLDALGSVAAITDEAGQVLETRHYEPFGGRTDEDGAPIFGVRAGSTEPMGFAGLRHDDEIGLIDQRGRVYDPTIRRFLSPDPHVTDPFQGQSYNRYSYALNNPATLVDPSGFDWWGGGGGGGGCLGLECSGGASGWEGVSNAGSSWGVTGNWVTATPTSAGSGSSTPRFASGGAVTSVEEQRPVSVPTGPSAPSAGSAGPVGKAWAVSAAGGGGEADTGGSWKDNALVQGIGGFVGGLGLGLVPGGGVIDQGLSAAKVLDRGTRAAQIGKALGEIVGGAVLTVGGAGGEVAGIGVSTTGIGAVVGAPAMMVSAVAVTGGLGNIAQGLSGFGQALMTGGGNAVKGEGTDAPNMAAQDKMLSKGEIKALKEAGIDVHELKPDRAGRYDLYKDSEGNVLVKPKAGSGPGDPTGININNIMHGGD